MKRREPKRLFAPATSGPLLGEPSAWRAVRPHVGEKLAKFKVPSYVEVRDEPLPRNATGKVMKHVLTGDGENNFVEE